MCLGRVYIRFGKDYKGYTRFSNFDELLEAVAFSVQYGNGRNLVKSIAGKKVACLSHTKKYIAEEATRLISRFGRNNQGDHMALYASKNQINRLIRVCEHDSNLLSCYSFVVLHIIYISINQEERNKLQVDFNKLDNLIYHLANAYLRDNGHDDLAQFVVDCHPPIEVEIHGGAICRPADFPDVHRWY